HRHEVEDDVEEEGADDDHARQREAQRCASVMPAATGTRGGGAGESSQRVSATRYLPYSRSSRPNVAESRHQLARWSSGLLTGKAISCRSGMTMASSAMLRGM